MYPVFMKKNLTKPILLIMKSIKLIIVFLFFCATLIAQDDTDLMKQLEKDSGKINYTTSTFKSTRLITGHTVET